MYERMFSSKNRNDFIKEEFSLDGNVYKIMN